LKPSGIIRTAFSVLPETTAPDGDTLLKLSYIVFYIVYWVDKMKSEDSRLQLLDCFDIDISRKELAAGINARGNRDQILDRAARVLLTVQGCWRPRAVVRRLLVERVTDTGMVTLRPLDQGEAGTLDLGFAGKFMAAADQGLVAVFTAGDELERETAIASKEKRIMDAYLCDLIGLTVLEKVRRQINRIIEEQARARNWGVSPFLSPGSVHGWELGDQDNLCNFVPIEKIGVTRGKNGILKPFKTISCLVGIGPGYTARTVGETCDVCSKREQCSVRLREEEKTIS
jgi:hypothetical protein